MPDDYTTLAAPHEAEIDKIKRSRFIGLAAPAADVAAADAFVAAARSRFHDARHVAFAWRIGAASRASDDSEPRRSAGAPILQQIDGRGLRDVVVAVVRYYGGVKLGTGGLARAYGGAAAAVLAGAALRRVVTRVPVAVSCGYDGLSAVQRVLHGLGLEPVEAEYGAGVRLVLHLEPGRAEDAAARLREATGGRGIEVLAGVAVDAG